MAQQPPPAPVPDPKFAKFTGEGKLKIEAFLTIFENAFTTLGDAAKVTKLTNYLDGEPLNFFATDVLSVPNIAWADVRRLFEARFGHGEIPPMTAALKRRLERNEGIKDYYDDKANLLRQAHIHEDQISSILTEGLPHAYKPHFFGKRFRSPAEWLQLALDIEVDMKASLGVPNSSQRRQIHHNTGEHFCHRRAHHNTTGRQFRYSKGEHQSNSGCCHS